MFPHYARVGHDLEDGSDVSTIWCRVHVRKLYLEDGGADADETHTRINTKPTRTKY